MKRAFILSLFIISVSVANVLNYINSIRVHSGASPLKYSKILSFSAKKHAIYLETNREFGHSENRNKINFFGAMPWDRIINAGFGSKAVVENISFGERSYNASIDKIMATVYHRLAFLETKIDSIGFAKFDNIYVYDMGNSKISSLCKKSFLIKGYAMQNLCKNRYKEIPLNIFKNVLNKTNSYSKDIIIYPYSKQKDVAVSLANERPKFTYKRNCGLPISIIFNNYYYKQVFIKNFELKVKNRVVSSKIVTFRNDRRKKLKKNSFVLLPLQKLKHHTKYRVFLQTIINGKLKKVSWSFTTR